MQVALVLLPGPTGATPILVTASTPESLSILAELQTAI